VTLPGANDDRDALLQQARALRVSQRIPDALAVLSRLQLLHPRFSRIYQERGHCYVLLGDATAAIAALREAVRLNPSLPTSWNMLEQLYRMVGEIGQAGLAAKHHAALMALPAELVVANCLFADGDISSAEDLVTDYLRRDADNLGARRLLARIRLEQSALGEAEILFAAILSHAPEYQSARLDYALVLLQQQKHLPARQQAQRLIEQDPHNRDYLKLYGAACIGLGDYEPIIDLYERLLAAPGQTGSEIADLRLWRANALKVTGRLQEAITEYRAALAARPDFSVAWYSLANLKTFRFSDRDISQMRDALAEPGLRDLDLAYLGFALGKALEDKCDYPASWGFYETGNAARRRSIQYRPEATETYASRLAQVFTAEAFHARTGWGLEDPAPIFILGLPRSGSTLIEQILASHSKVEGTQELTEIDRYVGELCGRDPDSGLPVDPAAILRLSAGEVRALGKRFLTDTRAYRRLGRPFFTDKAPGNFWHIGLIHLILPKATIIDVRREPMACGFSNFKQLFGGAHHEFTYDLEHIGHYYRIYLDLMRHWDAVLPGQVLRVRYEDLVEDLEGGVRRILDLSHLPYEPACLAFHATSRSIRTPSSEQVRRPISRESLDQWRHYASMLDLLRGALGDAVTVYRD